MNKIHLLAAPVIALTSITAASAAETAVDQVAQSLSVIAEKDATYNAVTQLNPTANSDAKELDTLGLNDTNQRPLAGMPILLKDNIDLKGMATTAGSLALRNNFPARDAELVAQLKSDGAIMLGKANLSEWANFRSEKSSSGWSAVGGQTHNAYDETRSPCGSSAGSGVAVALGYVKVAIGTETNGSIVCPASANGVVGFKPTHGLVSGDGIVPLALTQDTAGPIADSIDNAALVLASMIDPKAKSAQEIRQGLRGYKNGKSLTGLKIGILSSTKGFDVRRDALLDAAITKLKEAGVEVIEDLALDAPDGFWGESYQVLQHEFKHDLNDYFKAREYQDKDNSLRSMTLEQLITFNSENADTELKHFDQDIFDKSHALELSTDDYQAMLARIKKATREDGLDKLYKEHNLAGMIGITVGPAWKIDHINGDSFFGPGSSSFPAIGGHPHITVPGGKIAGMPVGLSFIGKRYADHELAQLVYQFTQIEASKK